MAPLRPTDSQFKAWNFFESCPEDEKTKHVLRFNAKPEAAYCDGRVEAIMQNLEEIAMNLMGHNEPLWSSLQKHTLQVFDHEAKALTKALADAQ